MARPSYEPTDQQRAIVQALIACGLTYEQIATYLNISPVTMRKAFRKELAEGFDKTYAVVVGKLMQNILEGDRSSIFFWLKTKARWRETSTHELTGPDGKALSFANVPDDQLSQLTAALRASLVAPASRGGGEPPGDEDGEG